MLPSKINIKYIELEDDAPIEKEMGVFIIFNYNARNSFLNAEGLKYSDFQEMFDGLLPKKDENGNITNFDELEKSGYQFGKLTYHAIKEGMRMVKKDFTLTEEDIHAHINDDPQNFIEIMRHWSGSNPKASDEDGDKKKAEKK